MTEDVFTIFQLLSNLIAFELEAEEDQNRRAAELREARETAQAREQLMGILGHDLRNPLNVVKIGTSVLLHGSIPAAKQQGILGQISRSADRMERMIGDLLDFTRSRLGEGIPVAPQSVDLGVLMRQALEEFGMSNPDQKVQLRATADCQVTADPDRFTQVVSNLIANAIQHSPPGTAVSVRLEGFEADVRLSVHNHGIPIATESLSSLFEPFRRGGDAANEPHLPTSGLGLGLYIVSQIMRAHGGSISVCSTAGEGTTFTARWPRRESTEHQKPEALARG